MKTGSGQHSSRRSLPNGMIQRAFPPLLPTFCYALAFGLAAGSGALANVMLDGWQTPEKIRTIFMLFSAGGFLAFPLGLVIARFLAHDARWQTAFAAAFVAFTLTTLIITALIFGLQYRVYYAQWHQDALTRIWFLQYFFTMAVALYQFAVLGLRLYFPFGFVILLCVSAWFARRLR